MKFILLSLLLISNVSAEELCAPVPEEVISVLTTLSVPNCRNTSSILTSVRVSKNDQNKLANGRAITPGQNPICDECRLDFQRRVSGAVDISVEKKRAFFDTSYKELEKAMSSIVIDAVSLRTTYSTNTNFPKSITACNTRSIEQELTRCNSPMLNAFKQKNLSARLGNETAALISSSQAGIAGILERPDETRSCNISDEVVQSLKPRLFEELITPAIVESISSIAAANSSELSAKLRIALGESFDVVSKHPILKELIKDPSTFLQTFRSLRTQTPERLKDAFRAAIYNPTMGSLVDSSNSSKCESTIRSFTSAMCSPQLKSGNVSLGPFSNFDKFLDRGEVSDSDLTINEGQLKNNLVMFEFCNQVSNDTLSLQQVMTQMNSWMNTDDRNSPLSTYANNKYNRDFGDTKASICGYLPKTTCPDSDGTQCALYKLYRLTLDASTPEGRLASSPDRGMNSVLRSLIGDPAGVSSQSREILVAEGILPQANGELVERPTPPERQPEYLANVANGTITPNTSSATAANSNATQNKRANKPQAQPVLAQPNAQAAAALAETQLPAASADDEDMRRFQDGLDERLRRAEGTIDPTQTQLQSQLARRGTTRVEPGRPQIRQAGSFIPTEANVPVQTDSVIPTLASPGAPAGQDVNLAPDTTRQTRAQRQANEARAQMAGARSNPAASGEAGRGPASVEGNNSGDSTVALTISGDISSNLEQVLRGSDSRGSDLRSLIDARRPFKFQLNDSLFDVRFRNGVYTVAYRSGDENQRSLASTLQTLFNNSISAAERTPARTNTLEQLQNSVRR